MIRFTLAVIVVFGANPSRAEPPKLFREKSFTCATMAKAANYYIALGEKASIKELESEILDWDKDFEGQFSRNARIGWVCRIVFQPKGKQPLRGPAYGELHLPWNSMPLTKWPLYPVARTGSSYFALGEGYTLLGVREDPKHYLNYCREKGKFRTERVPEPTKRQALKDLEELRQSEAWKAIKWKDSGEGFSYTISESWIWEFIKAQVEEMPETGKKKGTSGKKKGTGKEKGDIVNYSGVSSWNSEGRLSDFFRGRPRGLRLDSNPSCSATRSFHAAAPYGRRRRMRSRSASTSASVCGVFTCSSQDNGRGTGPTSRAGELKRGGAALDHGQPWAWVTRPARTGLRSMYRSTVRRCSSS